MTLYAIFFFLQFLITFICISKKFKQGGNITQARSCSYGPEYCCPLDFQSSLIPRLRSLLGQSRILHIILHTVPSTLPWTILRFGSTNSIVTAFHPIDVRSTCPNHLNLPFLIIRLIDFNPNKSEA